MIERLSDVDGGLARFAKLNRDRVAARYGRAAENSVAVLVLGKSQ